MFFITKIKFGKNKYKTIEDARVKFSEFKLETLYTIDETDEHYIFYVNRNNYQTTKDNKKIFDELNQIELFYIS